MSLDLVALLTLAPRNSDHDRAEICLRSLDVNLQGPLEVVIACPQGDVATLTDLFARRTWKQISVRVMDETPLLTREIVDDKKVRGTVRQMLVKLSFASVCRTRFYLTLDADVALIKPLDPASLLPNGRGLLQPQPSGSQRKWFTASAKLHGEPPAYTEEEGMSVTPAVLSTPMVRSLMRHLEARHGNWRRALADAHAAGDLWTEYTLYYHHLAHLGAVEKVHRSPPRGRLFVNHCIWRKDDIPKWELERALRQPGWFVVLQSSSGLLPEEVRRMLAPVVPMGEPGTPLSQAPS